MKKEIKSNVKAEVATGLSSSVGATIGMIIGSAISAEVNAMEVPEPTPVPTPNPAPSKPEPSKPEPVKPEPPKPEPVKPEPPKPEPQPEPEVEVLGYETIQNNDGSLMDVALVRVDGQEVAFIDGDMDGMADVYVLDMNGNGILEEEEFIPIRDQSLAMAPLREAVYGQEPLVAQDDDYINNADVDDFMA